MRFLLLGIVVLLSCASVEKDEKTILWEEKRLLSWDDFQGRVEHRFAGASTHYNLVKEMMDHDTYADVDVKALFFCKKSWKRPMWVNESLLAHEQKHFDITELYARKLRMMMQKETYPDYETLKFRTDSMYDVVDKEMDKYQDLYDEETNSSMYGDGQRAWSKKIMEEIHSLDKYKTVSWEIKFTNP